MRSSSRLPDRWIVTLVLLTAILIAFPATSDEGSWPQRVLLTNDDGIGEGRLHALARAFAERSETWVVASFVDRSGSSNYSSIGKYNRTLFARREHVEGRLVFYGVSGYPADAVGLGVLGLLRETPPDLVVSGVNGGPNLGSDGWWGSGTIGAARAAAYMGIPAVAVSGLDDGDAEMVQRVNAWVVELAGSALVRELEPGEYLTVAFPHLPAAEIRGIRVAPRAASALDVSLERVHMEEDDDETEEVWMATMTIDPARISPESDAALLHQGYIVVTPMRVGEVDDDALERLEGRSDELPAWVSTGSD